MHKLIKITLAAALPVLWVAGCSDFLKGGLLTNNPNNPLQGSATNSQLFIPIQVNQFAQQNSEVAWSIAQWMQSLYGAARQQVGVYNYSSLNNGTFDGDFNTVYTGGGLLDLRQLQTQAIAVDDNIFRGIAMVMEGWMMGNAADWWGDIPYSQAVDYTTYPTPVLDLQAQVYAGVMAKLDSANIFLPMGGVGPAAGSDLVYAGDTAKWGHLAHTLKARFLLHQVLSGGATYAQVLAEANKGIASNAGDYLGYFAPGIQLSSNNWWQFMSANGGTGRAGDMIAGDTTKIIKILKAAGDPRFAEYFNLATTGTGNGAGSGFMSAFRLSSGYRQPLVTYNENQLIIAEALLHTGNPVGALTALQNEQASWATATTWHTARTVTPATVANDSTIGTEKYITLFQNVEVWNDWKRLCVPALQPVDANPTFGNTIPSRLLYGNTEQETNPNVPAVGVGSNGAFNTNDTRQGCTK